MENTFKDKTTTIEITITKMILIRKCRISMDKLKYLHHLSKIIDTH